MAETRNRTAASPKATSPKATSPTAAASAAPTAAPASQDAPFVREAPRLAIVVPCYNEEEALPQSAPVLVAKLRQLVQEGLAAPGSRVVCVDDGSKDATWEVIAHLHDSGQPLCGVKLAHNRGHQNALLCGLMWARVQGFGATISIDADLQDDVDVMEGMMAQYRQGCEVVYGVRASRDTDTGFKRNTAQGYYRLMERMGTELVYNAADYRMMGAAALEALSQYREVNLFLRGIVPSLGFKTGEVYYDRAERIAGESKYPLSKMVGLAVDGITSFSVKPMQVITVVGAVSMLIALVMLVYTIVSVATGHAVAGWGSIMVSIWLVGGFLILAVGITGEYVGKAYLEAKHRPRYVVETVLD